MKKERVNSILSARRPFECQKAMTKNQVKQLVFKCQNKYNFPTIKLLQSAKKGKRDQRMEGRTDGPTDTVTYRIACMRLKNTF